MKKLHSDTALEVSQWDGTKGRRVWFQYWDAQLTYQKSHFARLS
jgi:putative transposase